MSKKTPRLDALERQVAVLQECAEAEGTARHQDVIDILSKLQDLKDMVREQATTIVQLESYAQLVQAAATKISSNYQDVLAADQTKELKKLITQGLSRLPTISY